ncbi:hypothetical protein D0864_07046 [Hortaea werneckii]|uniref:Response regulatory domain-containing protein n=1 Tax=Hortaea werneckii TaxID=91943 RepID=A0A3M7FD94_HORWE|nr:hypothetical protein D0864_07046 [Hortaea werneckii]
MELAPRYQYDKLAKERRLLFVFKPLKPSRFGAIFDPQREREMSTDRNQDSAQQVALTQKQVFEELGQRLSGKDKRVLLVEDNRVNQMVILKFLAKVNIKVDTVLDGSHLLRLPSELRIKIYELILAFNRPIKLRQTIAGSENTNILRTSKQVYEESLPVLFDINTVAVTLNDFCERTDSSLRCPVPTKRIRHMLVTSFAESIACNFLLDRCSICDITTEGFLRKIDSMSQLRSVIVEYQTHIGNFTRFKSFINQETCGELRSRIWPRAVALADSARDERQEVETLSELREIDHDIPDKVWLLLCTKKYGAADQYWGAVSKAWQRLDAQEASDGDEHDVF